MLVYQLGIQYNIKHEMSVINSPLHLKHFLTKCNKTRRSDLLISNGIFISKKIYSEAENLLRIATSKVVVAIMSRKMSISVGLRRGSETNSVRVKRCLRQPLSLTGQWTRYNVMGQLIMDFALRSYPVLDFQYCISYAFP